MKRSFASIHVDPPARQRSCSTTSACSDDLYTSTTALEPRADVISRAEETGRPLPSPSQEMQRAVVAGDRTDTEGDEEEGDNATKPGERVKKRKMADRSGSSLLGSSQSQEVQEVQEVPGLSLLPPTPTAESAPPAKEAAKSSKTKGRTRAPAPKKARTTRDTLTADAPARGEGSDADEVPGLFLLRRSPRLNPS